MNTTNINNINSLLRDRFYIKLQDYKILTQQLNIIKKNSRNIFNSNISYGNTQNRVLLEYEDISIKEKLQMYVYFSKISSEEFEANIYDIPHVSKITFNYLLKTNTSPFIINTIDIDNEPIDIATNVETIKNSNYNSITINLPSTILNSGIENNIEFQINSRTYRINILRSDVYIYYNKNPLSNNIISTVVRNTNQNTLTDLSQKIGTNFKKNEYNIYDFSIKLDNTLPK